VEVLALARQQIAYMTPERRTAWGIPPEQFTEYGTLFGAAQAAFQKVQNKAERTHVQTVQCQEAFAALEAKMRFIRDRWHKIPPLTQEDWAALGYAAKDDRPSVIPAPGDVPQVSLSPVGAPHVLLATLEPLPGTQVLTGKSDYGYAVFVGVMPPGGATLEQAASVKHYLQTPPLDGKPLQHHRFTLRKHEPITFDAEDAGMTAWVCARYENQKGWIGNWGPPVSRVIP
jgi:hypothetical protein